jgi:hypothetical protein
MPLDIQMSSTLYGILEYPRYLDTIAVHDFSHVISHLLPDIRT